MKDYCFMLISLYKIYRCLPTSNILKVTTCWFQTESPKCETVILSAICLLYCFNGIVATLICAVDLCNYNNFVLNTQFIYSDYLTGFSMSLDQLYIIIWNKWWLNHPRFWLCSTLGQRSFVSDVYVRGALWTIGSQTVVRVPLVAACAIQGYGWNYINHGIIKKKKSFPVNSLSLSLFRSWRVAHATRVCAVSVSADLPQRAIRVGRSRAPTNALTIDPI